jgi:lysozyme
MTREVLEIALPLILRFEGLRLRPYLCSAGVPTVGVGCTRYADGRMVTLQDPPISKEAAMRLFELQVQRDYLPAVVALCPGADTPTRLAVLTSFCFNLGKGALKASTLRKRVNAGDWVGAKAELLKWDKAGGKRVRGLTIRREAEAALL